MCDATTQGASVLPSDEDSQAFVITSHGDTWKLKGVCNGYSKHDLILPS
jgi:hypothetical protein